MYFYLGGKAVLSNEIIGIFDLDTTTVSKRTRDYLEHAEKSGETEYTSYDLPKTFVVAKKKSKKTKVYVSAVTAQTIVKRAP